jgi:ribosomal protein S3
MKPGCGMMWFDNDSKTTLQSKIEKGFEYYKEKYGGIVITVYVNQEVVAPEKIEVEYKKEKYEVKIKKIRGMVKNNFLFYEKQEKEANNDRDISNVSETN